MPLPDNGQSWPPPRHTKALASMAEWSAWYGGDPATLTDYYSLAANTRARTRPSQTRGGVVGAVARWWWGTPTPTGEKPAKLHVPLAADICGTSADLLFSEPVILTGDNETLQEALDELQGNGLDSQLHEAAEVTAALGGGYLRVVWDEDLQPMPWTDTVHADMALPEFRWGKLAAVTFWQKLPSYGSDQQVWRLLERHEPGRILHALYRGKDDNLGTMVPLEEHPDAEHLAALVDEDGAVLTGTDRLTATYVPNMLPNRLDRGSHQGRSDLQGVEPWLDALDEAYSSWWRDIRHAKSRIHVPAHYIQSDGPGRAGMTDVDRELYVPLEGVLGGPQNTLESMIQVQQFDIRVSEHKDTCEFWTNKIIESAGYSTQSLSSGSGGAVTAAEVHSHERRSYMTRGKKVRYWQYAVKEHLETLVEVANANMGAGIREGAIKVEFQDGVQESAMNLAQTAQALRNAEAASVKTRVQMLHPDWDDVDIQAEAAAILAETGGAPLADPDTIHLSGAPVIDPAEVKAKADAMGALIRSGAEPLAAAREVGFTDLTFTGAVPTTLRVPEADAAALEDA